MGDRRRLTIDMDAVDDDTLAEKLRDIEYELISGKQGQQSVFASPSCKGVITLTDMDEADRG